MRHTIEAVNYWQTSEEMIRSVRRRNSSVGILNEGEEQYTHATNALGIRVRISSDNTVGIITGRIARVRFPAGKDFSLTASRLVLGPTQPAVQWVSRVKRQGREADHSLPSSADVKNNGAIHPLSHMSGWRSA
jgi:hypothetical protein